MFNIILDDPGYLLLQTSFLYALFKQAVNQHSGNEKLIVKVLGKPRVSQLQKKSEENVKLFITLVQYSQSMNKSLSKKWKKNKRL